MTQQQEERKEALADSLRDLLKHEAIEKLPSIRFVRKQKCTGARFIAILRINMI